jgi:hypothetical protein
LPATAAAAQPFVADGPFHLRDMLPLVQPHLLGPEVPLPYRRHGKRKDQTYHQNLGHLNSLDAFCYSECSFY